MNPLPTVGFGLATDSEKFAMRESCAHGRWMFRRVDTAEDIQVMVFLFSDEK